MADTDRVVVSPSLVTTCIKDLEKTTRTLLAALSEPARLQLQLHLNINADRDPHFVERGGGHPLGETVRTSADALMQMLLSVALQQHHNLSQHRSSSAEGKA